MNILISRFTNQVVGLNRPATPLEIEVCVADSFTLYKNVEEVVGYTEGEEPTPITQVKSVTLQDTPEAFTLDEVLAGKYNAVRSASNVEHMVADMFLNEDDLNLAHPLHSANTGVGIVQLLPYGQVTTNAIPLDVPASVFTLTEFDAESGVHMYVNGVMFDNGVATLTEATDTCIFTFTNSTDRTRMAYSYAVGY